MTFHIHKKKKTITEHCSYSPNQIEKTQNGTLNTPFQGCALRKITRSPKVPNYKIQGAQHKAYMKEIRLSGRPKTKVSCLRHPGTLRAQLFLHKLYFGNLHKFRSDILLEKVYRS